MSPDPVPWPSFDEPPAVALVKGVAETDTDGVLLALPVPGGPSSDRAANPWHGHRPSVFAIMRDIDRMASVYDDRAKFLERGVGRPVGGAAFDERLRAETLWSFLRWLRRGQSPAHAYAEAMDESRTMVRSWNHNPRCVVINHKSEAGRYEDTCAPMLDDLVRRFAPFGEPSAPTAVPELPRNRGVDGTIVAPGV